MSFDYFVTTELQATPTPDQQEFIDAIQEAVDKTGKSSISIRSGHGTGKTSGLAWLILWIGLTKEDAKIPTTAPVAAQLANLLIPEVLKWKKHMTDDFQSIVDVQSMDVKFSNGNRCFARTARKENTEALAGVHAKFVCYIIDEASGIDQAIFDVIEGALTGDNFIFIMTSNPTRTIGTFYDSHKKNRKHYKTLHFNSLNSPNVNKTWVESMKEKYGEDSDVYRVRVLGEFPESSTDALFSSKLIEESRGRIRAATDGIFTYAVDVARYGDDKSTLSKRKGQQVYMDGEWSKLNTMELASMIAHKYNEEEVKPDAVFVDAIGVGAGVADRLIQLGLPVIEVIGSAAADDIQYFNKRTEMYYGLQKFMVSGMVVTDEDTEEELKATSYKFSVKGDKLQVISKDDIKAEIGRSPDKADAHAMHFSHSIFKRVEEYEHINEGSEW